MLHCRLTGQQRAWEPLSDSGLWPLISEMKSCCNNQQLHHHKTAINGLNITTNRITWNEIIIFKLWGGISQGRKGCHSPIFLSDKPFLSVHVQQIPPFLVISLPLLDVTSGAPIVRCQWLTAHSAPSLSNGPWDIVWGVTSHSWDRDMNMNMRHSSPWVFLSSLNPKSQFELLEQGTQA